MSEFKRMQFLVDNQKHSAEIQEALFGLGYKWCDEGARVRTHNVTCLFSEEHGGITYVTNGKEPWTGYTMTTLEDIIPKVKVEASAALNPKAGIGSKSVPLTQASPFLTLYAALGKYNGALKYGTSNFVGTNVVLSIYIDAIQRHLDKFKTGEEVDEVDLVPHLGAILANIDIILMARAADTLIDDRPLARGYSEELKRLTPLIASLQELHKERNPKHYYLNEKDD